MRLDATHPAARLPKAAYGSAFPRFGSPALQVRAFPKALLMTPAAPWPDPPFPPARAVPWGEQLDRLLGRTAEEGEVKSMRVDSLDMAMVCIVGIKATHKSAVVRKKIAARLKTAVALVATRGAQVQGPSKELVFREGERPPAEWVSPGVYS